MKWANLLRRWTVQSLHAAILGSALLGSASVAMAQLPAITASKLPSINYTRSQTFNLPVVMDRSDRATLSEIRLYVKTPSTGWSLQERGPASLEHFACKVTQDGEYWYTLALVDRAGRMSPADVNMEPPSQRVVVDTTQPTIDVQPWNVDGDFCLRCTVQDANPDHAALKAVCRTGVAEVPLEMVPNQPGVFRVRGAEMMQFPVVVSTTDLAKNVAVKEVNLREMIGSTLAPKGQGPIAQASGRPDKGTPTPPVLPPLPKDGPGQITNFAPAPPPPPIQPPATHDVPPRFTPDTPVKAAAPASPTSPTAHRLINTTHASVDFRIDQVGPSGVGKVQLYMTPDQGQTWHPLGEAKDKRSPAEINLPGDGVYGIRVVVTNGNGFGGKTPVRGDTAHYTIEVDATAPFVQMRSAELLTGSGHVELKWNATDKNLGNDAVSLFYRTRPDAAWQPIAKGIKNEGVHRWAFPRDAGGQFFFKVEVTDQAGNLSQSSSAQPVVIDMSEPRVTVVGVTGAARP